MKDQLLSSLKDKLIVITGASRGIGAACVKLCLETGGRVMAVSRSEKNLKMLKQQHHHHPNLIIRACDVSLEQQVKQLFADIKAEYGAYHGLVQSAAVFQYAKIKDMNLTTWHEVINTNLTGSFLCLQAALGSMAAYGSIVNLSSLSGVPGVEKFHGFSAYNISKYGVLGLTEIGAVEGVENKIRVNCLSPGAVDTEMLKQAAPDLAPAMTGEEVARVVVFLLSDASRAINGENIILNGHPAGPIKEASYDDGH